MKKILILTLWLSLQPLFSHTAGLQRARLTKALFVTAGTAAAGIGAYYANKIGDARYKAMYDKLYPSTATQTYPNQNNRFLRTARNILTVLSGADTVDATALNGDTPPRLYRLFSSIPGWESLAKKTGIRNIAPTVVTLNAQSLDQSKFTLAQSNVGLNVTDTSGNTRFLNINNNYVTSDLYGRKTPIRYKLTNMPAQITSVNAQQQISGAANLGQQNIQTLSPATGFSAPTGIGFGPQYGQQGHGAPSAATLQPDPTTGNGFATSSSTTPPRKQTQEGRAALQAFALLVRNASFEFSSHSLPNDVHSLAYITETATFHQNQNYDVFVTIGSFTSKILQVDQNTFVTEGLYGSNNKKPLVIRKGHFKDYLPSDTDTPQYTPVPVPPVPSAAAPSGTGFPPGFGAQVTQAQLHPQQLANTPINKTPAQKLDNFYEFLCDQKDRTGSIIIEGNTIPFWDNPPTYSACLDITHQIPDNATFQLNDFGQPAIKFPDFDAPFKRVPNSWIFITQNMYNNQYLSIDLSKCPNFITYQQRKVTLQQQRQPVPPAHNSLSPFVQQTFFPGATNNQQQGAGGNHFQFGSPQHMQGNFPPPNTWGTPAASQFNTAGQPVPQATTHQVPAFRPSHIAAAQSTAPQPVQQQIQQPVQQQQFNATQSPVQQPVPPFQQQQFNAMQQPVPPFQQQHSANQVAWPQHQTSPAPIAPQQAPSYTQITQNGQKALNDFLEKKASYCKFFPIDTAGKNLIDIRYIPQEVTVSKGLDNEFSVKVENFTSYLFSTSDENVYITEYSFPMLGDKHILIDTTTAQQPIAPSPPTATPFPPPPAPASSIFPPAVVQQTPPIGLSAQYFGLDPHVIQGMASNPKNYTPQNLLDFLNNDYVTSFKFLTPHMLIEVTCTDQKKVEIQVHKLKGSIRHFVTNNLNHHTKKCS